VSHISTAVYVATPDPSAAATAVAAAPDLGSRPVTAATAAAPAAGP